MIPIGKILGADENIALLLTEDELLKLGERVVIDYDADIKSREEWAKRQKSSEELAKQITKKKTYPFEGASNIKFPLLAVSSLQFAARTYPAIIQGPEVVKARVDGDDPDGRLAAQAERKTHHMNHQLLEEMEEWEEGEDILINVLPVLGTVFKKTYFDPLLKRNVSELVMPSNYVVRYDAKPNKPPDRGTQEYNFTLNEIIERERSELFLELDDPDREKTGDEQKFDDDKSYLILEQHCLIDLDDDGYKEPYIVTVEHKNKQVLRIARRFEKDDIGYNPKKEIIKIDPEYYYTKFPFMPALDGSYYGVGFGDLLGPINDAIDSTINRLLDAGTLANLQGGFIGKGAKMPSGPMPLDAGGWQKIDVPGGDLKANIVPLNYKEPSIVLFQLLGLLMEEGKKLSSVADIMTGQSPGANTPATTVLTMVEQGMQLFTAIQKRIYRSRTEEIKKLCRLNKKYLDETGSFYSNGKKMEIMRSDYDTEEASIHPVADPSMVSSPMRMAKAQALRETMGDPGVNVHEIQRRYYEALGIPNIDEILPREQPQQGPDPALMIEIQKLDIERQKLQIQEAEVSAKIDETKTKAILNIAKAEGEEAGRQIDMYRQILEEIKFQRESTVEQQQPTATSPGTF